ncbi:hypothetical protein GUJ93_ZPchr0010g11153 [Zizania palustris]|uniref:Uncharacterized protein n=1 Tax=Zizania palustris TaxID=103762 RepID=A0A8J5WCY4_ZIZPA|nr:hypothetical protein GUJ93_ZPchr0010g11153 [Zizania palustris]
MSMQSDLNTGNPIEIVLQAIMKRLDSLTASGEARALSAPTSQQRQRRRPGGPAATPPGRGRQNPSRADDNDDDGQGDLLPHHQGRGRQNPSQADDDDSQRDPPPRHQVGDGRTLAEPSLRTMAAKGTSHHATKEGADRTLAEPTTTMAAARGPAIAPPGKGAPESLSGQQR